jgi:hypothetical protein
MNALEKLNKQAEKDQERIDRLNAKMAEAEAAIMRDPDNSKAALDAAAASMQAQAAQRALDNTLREAEAEKKRIYDQEVKAAQAELVEIQAKAVKIKEQEFTKAREFFKQYDAWLGLVNHHLEIAKKYGIAAPKLYDLDDGQAGITSLKRAMDQFTAAQQNLEVRRQALRAMADQNR